MYQISKEKIDDWWEVEALYDTAFGPGRSGLSSYRLREGVAPVEDLCFIARDADEILAGCIRYWPVRVEDAELLLLGPIAVHPTRQGEGIGGLLMARSLDAAREAGWLCVLLVGDEPYYARFGFQKMVQIEMPAPTNPDRVLGRELIPGGFDGISGLVERVKV